jgi:alanyl-tRNA synthetase
MNYGTLKLGDKVLCDYDELRRQPIRNNHTGTHILNFALKEVLGDEVNQKGSLVAPEKLRFDFSHKAGCTDAELTKIEEISTSYIRQNSEVYSKEVPLSLAREIQGVRAVFGETYPDPVRVVSVGVPVEDLLEDVHRPEWNKVSVEFCGGTHVRNTTEIKDLVILEESGIAKGIRRIIAVTGQTAHDVQLEASQWASLATQLEALPYGPEKESRVKESAAALNRLSISALSKSALRERFAALTKSNLDEQKKAQKAENAKILGLVNDHFTSNPSSNTLILGPLEVSPGTKAIQETIKTIAAKHKDKSVYILGTSTDGEEKKVIHGCHVSADAQGKGADASKWANEVATVVGGKAGGKGPTSLGQGPEGAKAKDAVEVARKYLEELKI